MLDMIWGSGAEIKKIVIFLISIVGLAGLFLICDFFVIVPTITVKNVEIKEGGEISGSYGINADDRKKMVENNYKLQEALITFEYHNQSFYKTIYGVRGQYETPENLPPVIVGNKPDMVSVEMVKIFSRTHVREYHSQELFRMAVPIDPKGYSDAEILEMLKTVKVVLIGGKDDVLAKLPLAKTDY